MSKQPSDSFLPSGAVPSPPPAVSPSQIPCSVPDHISPTGSGSRTSPVPKPYVHSLRSPPGVERPLSPPKTRSASADENPAALVDDWRAYASKLRCQSEGEKAHMLADRARAEEVMAEERALWDKERDILKARIAELEAELEKRAAGTPFLSSSLPQRGRPSGHGQQGALSFTSPGSNAVSVTGSSGSPSSRPAVPQESGRNADGSPFYAPASRNPSRTFEQSEVTALRVDTMFAARENPIRVTSKELTPSDFGVQSPQTSMSELETIPETPADSIDISHIQPDLEGVSIRTSALSPKFAAKILSPQTDSPSKLSPNIKPPGRDVKENENPAPKESSLSPNGRRVPDVEGLMLQPETQRLTMHAGHTPNHSLSRFSGLLEESGGVTPTQVDSESVQSHQPSAVAGDGIQEEDEDKELTGPLGLTNDMGKDDLFLAQLVEKLDEVKKSEGTSPSTESAASRLSDEEVIEKDNADADDDAPPLRLKPSLNFGRPIGRI